MNTQLTPLQESLYIINWISGHLRDTTETANKENLKEKDNYILHQLMKYCFIQICIVLEEWKKLESLSENNLKLKNTLRIVEPLLKEVKTWAGLKKFRNTLLAHFGRDFKDNFVPYWRALNGQKRPTTHYDFNFINSAILAANMALVKRHEADLVIAIKVLEADRRQYEANFTDKSNSIKSEEEYKLRKDKLWGDFISITNTVMNEEK